MAVFGPSAEAARIEGSKSFAKDVMRAAGVPYAESLSVARAPCVIKADGLAAGKGVFVCRDQQQLDAALRAAKALGDTIVIEELLEGEEISVFALCDGARASALPAVQDFKRVDEGDTGPNTGGMGSYSPVAGYGADEVEALVDLIHRPVLEELAARGAPFVGVLFGDPETQSLLPRLDGDLFGALVRAAGGDHSDLPFETAEAAAVTVVLAAGAYPAAGDIGSPIDGIADAESTGALVFHAGTALQDGRLVTSGGRILNVTSTGPTVADARERAYEACELISFPGMRYRRDIAAAVTHV